MGLTVMLWAALLIMSIIALCRKSAIRTVQFMLDIRRRATALSGLPGPPYGLLGALSAVSSRQLHRHATEWTDKYGPVWKVRFAMLHVVGVTDPVLARQLLRCKHLDKTRLLYAVLDKFLAGPNLLTGRTDKHWAAVPKGIAPAFSVANMRVAAKAITECAYKLVQGLHALGPEHAFNIDDLLLRESMDIIGRVGFQKEMGALDEVPLLQGGPPAKLGNASYVQVMLRCCEEVVRRIENPLAFFLGRFGGAETRAGDALYAKWQELVNTGLLQHIKGIERMPGSFADLLLSVKDPYTGLPLSDRQVLPEIAALFFAGIDTTGHTGTWALYLISQHPEVEAKVAAELDAAELLVTSARPQPRQCCYDDLARLPYLKCVIKEILRMFPPVGVGQIRISNKVDLVLGGGRLVIPRGTIVWVPHHAMHNSIHYWDRPNEFLPERWLDPATDLAQKPSALGWQEHITTSSGSTAPAAAAACDLDDAARARRYIPFAEGPRNCVGQSLAQTTLPITLAALLSHFTFRLADQMGGPEGVHARESYMLVTGIKGGMFMVATPRS